MKNNFYISFGAWLIVISLLGVPIVWRDALTALSGIFLILVSLGPTILKKLQPKQKKKKEELKFSNTPPPQEKEIKDEVVNEI